MFTKGLPQDMRRLDPVTKNPGPGRFTASGDEISQPGDDFVFGVAGLGEGEGETLGAMSHATDCCQFYRHPGVLELVLPRDRVVTQRIHLTVEQKCRRKAVRVLQAGRVSQRVVETCSVRQITHVAVVQRGR